MIGEQKTRDDGYVSIAAKVPLHVAQLFGILAEQRGMAAYELLQLLINGFLTAAKHDGPLTREMKLIIDSLKVDAAYNKAFNFASPTAQNNIAQIVLILQQPGKKGFGMTMIDRPFMDSATETRCIDTILERVTEVGMAELYKELRLLGVKMNTNSVRETLISLCDAQMTLELEKEFAAEMPGVGSCHDYGKVIEYGNVYKRKKHRTPDSVANSKQQRIVFDDDDRVTAQHEAGDDESNIDFKPFTSEW